MGRSARGGFLYGGMVGRRHRGEGRHGSGGHHLGLVPAQGTGGRHRVPREGQGVPLQQPRLRFGLLRRRVAEDGHSPGTGRDRRVESAGDLLDPHGRMGPCGRPGVCQQQCSSLPRETLQRRRMQGSGRRLECLERLRHHGREPLPLHLLGTGPRHDLLRLRGRQDQRFLLRPARICDCRRRAAGGCHDGRLGKGGRHPPGGRLLQGDPRRRHRQFRRGLLSPELEPRDLRRSFGRQSFGVLGHPLYGQ